MQFPLCICEQISLTLSSSHYSSVPSRLKHKNYGLRNYVEGIIAQLTKGKESVVTEIAYFYFSFLSLSVEFADYCVVVVFCNSLFANDKDASIFVNHDDELFDFLLQTRPIQSRCTKKLKEFKIHRCSHSRLNIGWIPNFCRYLKKCIFSLLYKCT